MAYQYKCELLTQDEADRLGNSCQTHKARDKFNAKEKPDEAIEIYKESGVNEWVKKNHNKMALLS